jgi:hypothetical protein
MSKLFFSALMIVAVSTAYAQEKVSGSPERVLRLP